MWIVIRLVLALLGFSVRQWRRGRLGKASGDYKGATYYVREHKDKKEIKSITLGMELPTPTWIRMHRESSFDRFCKKVGIANEQETGFRDFDDQVYVTCDHPTVARVLASDARLRTAVLAALGLGADKEGGAEGIRYDGTALWMEGIRKSEVTPELLGRLAELRLASAAISNEPRRWLADRFLWRALLVEGVLWAIAGYAIGGVAEHIAHAEDFHVWPLSLIMTGLVVALAALLSLLTVLALWLRGSSRGHRLLVESAILLTLGLPIASIQAVADTNRFLDDAPSRVIVVDAFTCEAHRRFASKRSKRYAVAVAVRRDDAGARDVALPLNIDVSPAICSRIGESNELQLEIAPGRWGLPWYRSMRAGDARWDAPT